MKQCCILRSGSKVCTNRSGTTRPDSKHSVEVRGDGVPALPIPIGVRSTVNPGNKRAVLKRTIATASRASARIYLHYNYHAVLDGCTVFAFGLSIENTQPITHYEVDVLYLDSSQSKRFLWDRIILSRRLQMFVTSIVVKVNDVFGTGLFCHVDCRCLSNHYCSQSKRCFWDRIILSHRW